MKRSLHPKRRINDGNVADSEVSRLNQRLQYLIQVIQQITVAHDLNSVMATVRTGARRLIGADGATFILRDNDQCYYADEDAISPLWKGNRFPMSCCISGWVILNQQSVVIEDIYADCRIPVDAYRPTFVKSLAMVPIRTRNPLGAIGTYWATPHVPTADEMNLLQTLADTAAIALDNLHLYEEQEHRIRERTAQLQQALDFEALLKRITDKVRDSVDERQILETVVQELAQGLGLNRCNTTLYNLEQATATVGYEYNRTLLGVVCERTRPMADFPELYAQLLRGETLQFCCLSQSDGLSEIEPHSLTLGCPIMDDQSVLGDIRLHRTVDVPFTDLEVRLGQQVANQCAIAIRQSRLYQAAQAQIRELEKLNHLQDDFLNTTSHELRTPLSSMKTAIQLMSLLLRQVGELLTPKIESCLRILQEECDHEITLINDLLLFQQLSAGVHTVLPSPIYLQDWLPNILENYGKTLNDHQINYQIDISSDIPPLVTDLTLLRRILDELFDNACKFTPSGETVLVRGRWDLSSKSDLDRHVQISITNTGIEIPDSELPHIFQQFYRIPSHDPWKYRGTGLGLALVKKMVSALGGVIEATSNAGQTCFMIELPLLQQVT